VVIIPFEDRQALSDLLVMGESQILGEMSICLVKTFDEAQHMALLPREERVSGALAKFEQFRLASQKNPASTMARHPTGQKILEEVLAAQPNHASAMLLLGEAQGRTPKALSLNGSLSRVLELSVAIIGRGPTGHWGLRPSADFDELAGALVEFKKLQPKVHPLCKMFARRMEEALISLRNGIAEGSMSKQEFRERMEDFLAKKKALEDEWRRLKTTPEVIESLGDRNQF